MSCSRGVVLDGSQAGWLSAPLCHALVARGLYCVTGDEPSAEVLTRRLESNRSGSPTRTLAAHFAGMSPKYLCKCKKTGWHIPEIRAMVYSEAQESPGALTTKTKKRRKEKHECYRYPKGSVGNH
jgi:hypothetical protein